MLRAFTVDFEKVSKSFLLLLAALPSLIASTFYTGASLKVPVIIVYDVATKILGTELFPQHNIAKITLALHVLFCSVRRTLYGERK